MKDWDWRARLKNVPKQDAIIRAVRARGAAPGDLRSAVHEASHALELGVRDGAWDFETIDFAIRTADVVSLEHRDTATWRAREFHAKGIGKFEVTARAVERLVAERLRVDIGKPAELAGVAVIEAAKIGVDLVSVEWMLKAIDFESYTAHARSLADRVMIIGGAQRVMPWLFDKPRRQRR